MGLTSLLFELLNISHFSKYEIQPDNTNILVSHQGKSIPFYIIMGYMCAVGTQNLKPKIKNYFSCL